MISFATTMALVRGLHLAATLSLLGTVGFIAWMLPAATGVPDPLRRRLNRLWWVSGLIALLAGVAWFTLQSAAIAGADNLSDLFDAIPLVAGQTRYGNVLMIRLSLLLVATGLAWAGPGRVAVRRRASRNEVYSAKRASIPLYLALILVIFALALQGMIGHAGATEGIIGDGLVLSESLHLLAAGLWLGALPPLWLSLRALGPPQAVAVCERFSPIGMACVVVLAGTGFGQGLELIGSIPALFGTTYGHIALLKITLFLVALVLAALNRLWLTDRLAAGAPGARRHLLVSISLETCIGLAIVTAAAFMASSVPAAHATPVWPFPRQFSLARVTANPGLRWDVIISVIAIGAAVVLMAAALVWRRFRLVALAILVLAIVLAGPSLSLLTAVAYPTSFQTSPTGFSAASIVRGKTLFAQNCVACHGAEGRGDGPAAASLRVRPANLTLPHILGHTDGEMFWWLTHGIDDPQGGLAMPGFAGVLSPDERWALIDYVRAHSAAFALQRVPLLDVPVRAPAFPVACADVAASRMADLRGHAVHVIAGEAAKHEPPISPQAGISTVTLVLPPDVGANPGPAPGSCVAADAAAWDAYAVLADVMPGNLAGTEFLVDPNGWLRAVHRPGAASGWVAGDELIAALRSIISNPVKPANGGEHEHH